MYIVLIGPTATQLHSATAAAAICYILYIKKKRNNRFYDFISSILLPSPLIICTFCSPRLLSHSSISFVRSFFFFCLKNIRILLFMFRSMVAYVMKYKNMALWIFPFIVFFVQGPRSSVVILAPPPTPSSAREIQNAYIKFD